MFLASGWKPEPPRSREPPVIIRDDENLDAPRIAATTE
jgi:hypothetical protein